MKISTLIDYYSDYAPKTVLQAIACYNRNHDFGSENRFRIDWNLFESILSNIENGCLIVTEKDMEALDEYRGNICTNKCDYFDEWDDMDVYLYNDDPFVERDFEG